MMQMVGAGFSDMQRLVRATLVSLAILLGSVAAQADEMAKMVLAAGIDPGFSHFYVAAEAGILKKHGIDAELKLGPSGGAMAPLVVSQQANAAVAGALVGINNHLVDPDFVAVAQINSYDHWYSIVALKTLKTLADLKGHKVGITRGTSSEAFWYAALAHFQLNAADFAEGVVNVEPPEMVAAIERGDIDAFASWEPWVSRTLLAEPKSQTLLDGYGILQDCAFIYMDRKWIEANRDTAQRFIAALIETDAYIHDNPEETKRIDETVLHLSPELADAMLPKLAFYLKLDQQSYDVTKVQVDQLKGRGRIKGAFGYDKFFDSDLLQTADPSRVALPKDMPE